MALAKPQEGAFTVMLELDGHDCQVEYEYEPGEESQTYGPPEDCYEGSDESISLLNVHFNGNWINSELFAQEQQERWLEQIREHHERLRESDLEDRAEARQRDLEDRFPQWEVA